MTELFAVRRPQLCGHRSPRCLRTMPFGRWLWHQQHPIHCAETRTRSRERAARRRLLDDAERAQRRRDIGRLAEAVVSVAILADGVIVLTATIFEESGVGLAVGIVVGAALIGTSAIWLLLVLSDSFRAWHWLD